jgi:hypothetical protein
MIVNKLFYALYNFYIKQKNKQQVIIIISSFKLTQYLNVNHIDFSISFICPNIVLTFKFFPQSYLDRHSLGDDETLSILDFDDFRRHLFVDR